MMRGTVRFGAAVLLSGVLAGVLSGCVHDPNHGVNLEEARKAAERIHPRPKPGVRMEPGHGG